jgi:type VI protein secretion system component VasK
MIGKVTEEVRRETGTGTDLWRVIASPIVWAAHFLFCYVYAAVYCEKAGRDAALAGPTLVILAATALALGLIALSTWRLWRVRGRSLTDNDFEFEHNTPEERHRFLSHVALMLCVLSAVAVLYVAIPMLYLTTCR